MLYKAVRIILLVIVSAFLLACGGGSDGNKTTTIPTNTVPITTQPTSNIVFSNDAKEYIASLSLFVPDISMYTVQQSLLALEKGAETVIAADELKCISNIDVEGEPSQPTKITLEYSTCSLEPGYIINYGLITIQNNIVQNTQNISFTADLSVDGVAIDFDSTYNVVFNTDNSIETLTISGASINLIIGGINETISDFNITKSVDLNNKNYSFQYDMSVESASLGGSFQCSSLALAGKLARMPSDFLLECESGSASTTIDSDSFEQAPLNAAFNFASFPFEFGELDVSEYAYAFEEFALDESFRFNDVKFLPEHNALIVNNGDNYVYYDWKQNSSIELDIPYSYIARDNMAVLEDEVALITSLHGTVTYSKFSLNDPSAHETANFNLKEMLNIENDTSGFVDKIQQQGTNFLLTYLAVNGTPNLYHVVVKIDISTGELVSYTELDNAYNSLYVINEQTLVGQLTSIYNSPFSVFNISDGSFEQAEDVTFEHGIRCLLDYTNNMKIVTSRGYLYSINTDTLEQNNEPQKLPYSYDCEDLVIGKNAYKEFTIIQDANTLRQADFYWYDADSLTFLSRTGHTFQSTFLDVSGNGVFNVKYAAKDYYILISPQAHTMVIVGRFSEKLFGED